MKPASSYFSAASPSRDEVLDRRTSADGVALVRRTTSVTERAEIVSVACEDGAVRLFIGTPPRNSLEPERGRGLHLTADEARHVAALLLREAAALGSDRGEGVDA